MCVCVLEEIAGLLWYSSWLIVMFHILGIGGEVYGPTTAADLSTLFDVGGIIGTKVLSV